MNTVLIPFPMQPDAPGSTTRSGFRCTVDADVLFDCDLLVAFFLDLVAFVGFFCAITGAGAITGEGTWDSPEVGCLLSSPSAISFFFDDLVTLDLLLTKTSAVLGGFRLGGMDIQPCSGTGLRDL
jgi:hypothetical protein